MPLWLFLCIPGYSLFYDKSKKLCNEVISLHSKKYRAKLSILNELTCNSISEVAKKYAVGKKTIEYFNTQRAYASKNDLTVEKFCLQTA